MFKFTFTNRIQYLLQKREWFVEYDTAVRNVRKAKVGIKEADRSGNGIYAAYHAKQLADEQVSLLLKARWDSRHEANRQYLAQKEAA